MTKVSRRQFVGTAATAAGILILPRRAFGATVPMIIHGNPQKAAYASPDEWVPVSSQGHWLAPGTGALSGIPSHTHVDMKFPVYAEVGREQFTVPFAMTMFNTDGKITGIFGTRIKSWTLDAATLPLVGNPDGVVTYTGTVTFDPMLGGAPLRGWYPYDLQALTRFTNRDQMRTTLRLSVYSMIDPQAKPYPNPGELTGMRILSICEIADATDPVSDRFGLTIMQIAEFLPINGPISPEKPWRVESVGYNYVGAGPRADGLFELRLNPNLHDGIPGTTLASATGSSVNNIYTLPTAMANGPHKLMYRWARANPAGDREVTAHLVFNATVGPGGVAQPPKSGGTPPSPPPPTTGAPLALTASASTVPAGQAYTVTGRADVTSGDVHNLRLDGKGAFTCSATMCTKTLSYTRAAGTYTHTLRAVHRNSSPWPEATIIVTVQ